MRWRKRENMQVRKRKDYFKELTGLIVKMDFLEEIYSEEYISDITMPDTVLVRKIILGFAETDIAVYLTELQKIYEKVSSIGRLSEEEIQTALILRDRLNILIQNRQSIYEQVNREGKEVFYRERFDSLKRAENMVSNAYAREHNYIKQAVLKKDSARNRLYKAVIRSELENIKEAYASK